MSVDASSCSFKPMSTTYHVSLTTIDASGLASSKEVARSSNYEIARKAARKAAGCGARFFMRGISMGFSGANGTAWIVG